MSSTQTLKAAAESRVRTDYTSWHAAGRTQGHFYDTCPSSGHHLMNDVYGRPVNQNTLDMRDAACNPHAPNPQTAHNHMQRENNERPYLPIAASGMRGAADFMGKSRDLIPQDLYGAGNRGNFVRHGYCGNHLPKPPAVVPQTYAERRVQSNRPPSHDTQTPFFHRG